MKKNWRVYTNWVENTTNLLMEKNVNKKIKKMATVDRISVSIFARFSRKYEKYPTYQQKNLYKPYIFGN